MGEPITDARAPDAERLSRLVDAARIGLVEFDRHGRAVFVNRHWRALTGCHDPLPIDGWRLLEWIHPDDRDEQVALWAATAGEGRRYSTTVRVPLDGGAVRHLDIQADPVRDDAGAVTGFVASLTDVTARTRGEEAARLSERLHRTVLDSLDEGLVILDPSGTIVTANPAAARITGVTLDELVGAPAIGATWAWFDEQGRPVELEDLPPTRTLRTGRSHTGVVGFRRAAADDPVWLRVRSQTMPGGDGVVLTFGDITDEKRASDALRTSEQRYRSFLENAPIGQVVTKLDATIVECNQKFADMLAMAPTEVIGRSPADLVHPDDLETAITVLGRLEDDPAAGDLADTEIRLVRADGRVIWVTGRAVVLADVNGEPELLHVAVTDVTEKRQAVAELGQLASIVESTSDIVGVIDFGSGRLLYLNRAARVLLGYVDRDITRVHSRRLYATDVIRLFRGEVEAAIRSGGNWTGELDMRRADGAVIRVWQTISGDVDEQGHITTLATVGRDVTERSEREVTLAHRATHDPLTDLPNRSLLLDHLELALARAARKGNYVALLFIDLDRFKAVNDNLGHEAGDELLRAVAHRIAKVVRPSDTLSRLGGDEFVILCEDIEDEGHAVAVTQRVTAAIEARPFVAAGTSIDVTASVGVALSGTDTTHPEALLRDADAAMYRAKDLGRNRHEVFDEGMRRLSAHRMALADELAQAIERNEIEVHFQPIVDLRTGGVVGVEGLARWRHPERGLLPPHEFIGLAEETGLIVGLGLAVLSRTCDQARRWEIELGALRAPRVHVNLSARQLTHSSLPSLVEGVLDQSLIEPARLCLEITESVLMEDAGKVITTLHALKDVGVELAIDDFGTGYSSLAYLRRFPVDVLKVDRSFVDGLGPDPHDTSIVAAIVNLAHTLDLECVAEGVETDEQVAALRRLGCEAAQGFVFARPEPVPAVNRHLVTAFDVDRPPTSR